MIAFKKVVTIEDPDRVVLSGLPFRRGQQVEIVMLAEEDQPDSKSDELRQLLRASQALPVAQAITEKQIEDEIAAYRAKR